MKSRLGSLAPVRSILEGGFVCKATGWLVFPEAPPCLPWPRLGLAELFDVGGDHLGQGFKEQELQFLEPRDRAVVLGASYKERAQSLGCLSWKKAPPRICFPRSQSQAFWGCCSVQCWEAGVSPGAWGRDQSRPQPFGGARSVS